MDFLTNNFALFVSVLLLIAGVIGGKYLVWLRWVNEVAIFAWELAEKMGITEGFDHLDKLAYYMEIWKTEYRKKYNQEINTPTALKAIDKASELSIKDKVYRQSVPKSWPV